MGFLRFWFIFALATAVLTKGDDCTLHELHRCLESLKSVTSNDLVFGTTRKELLSSCSTLKQSVGCVDEHMNNCFSTTQKQVFNQVVAGARQFLVQLCVEGPIQEGYLRHAPCFKNVSLSEEMCAPKYRHLIHLSENVETQTNVDEGLRSSCCAFNAFVECKAHFVRTYCGQEAAVFLDRHLDDISSPLLLEHCAHYTFASGSCSTISGTPSPLATPSLLYLLICCLIGQLWTAKLSRWL